MSRAIRRLLRDETGSLSVEAVIILPVLAWAFVSGFVFFDAFRQQSINDKAALTIADIVAREVIPLTDTYIDNLHALHNFLGKSATPTDLILTVARYDPAAGLYSVLWSQARGGGSTLDDAGLNALSSQLPEMPAQDTVIVVQTSADFEPIFGVGLRAFPIRKLVVMRPRRAPQVCWQTCEGDHTTSARTGTDP